MSTKRLKVAHFTVFAIARILEILILPARILFDMGEFLVSLFLGSSDAEEEFRYFACFMFALCQFFNSDVKMLSTFCYVV